MSKVKEQTYIKFGVFYPSKQSVRQFATCSDGNWCKSRDSTHISQCIDARNIRILKFITFDKSAGILMNSRSRKIKLGNIGITSNSVYQFIKSAEILFSISAVQKERL